MISITVKYNGGKVKLTGEGPQKYQWFELGKYAVETIRDRVSRGIGSDDAPMPALSGRGSSVSANGKFVRQRPGYREQKQRAGGKPIRDLFGKGNQGGHMLDGLRVREATPTSVRIDITSRWGRIKARANEQRSPWYGFSANDRRLIFARMIDTFKDQYRAGGAAARIRGGSTVFSDGSIRRSA